MLADLRQSSALVKTADVLAGICAASLAIILAHPHGLRDAGLRETASGYITATNVLWVVFFGWSWNRTLAILGLYTRNRVGKLRFLGQCLKLSCVMAGVLGLCLASHRAYGHLGKTLVLFMAIAMTVECARRLLVNRLIASAVRKSESAIIVGTGRRAQRAWRELRVAHDQAVTFLGFVDECDLDTVAPDIRERFLCGLDGLPEYLLHNSVDTLIVATSLRSSFGLTRHAVAIAEAFHLRVLFLEDTLELGKPLVALASTPVFHELAGRGKVPAFSIACKRTLDIFLAATALLAGAPLLILIGIAVKVVLKDSVLQPQRRYGYRRLPFNMLSFNTTPTLASANAGPKPFALRFGAILQRTHLDRLPSLWNVLVGQMSLIGPEPMESIGPSPMDEPAWANLFTARPGLCGPSNMKAREERSLQQIIASDVSYLRDWTLWSDARLLVQLFLARVLKLDLSMGAWAASTRAFKRDRAI